MSVKGSISLVCFLVCFGALVLCQSSNNDTCPDGSPVVSWSQWVCNETAQTSFRTGSCNDTNTTVVQSKTGPLISWSPWSIWHPSCGLRVQFQDRSRDCVVPSSGVGYCSTCGYRNGSQHQARDADLPPCCEDLEYGPWSPWSPGCGNLSADTASPQHRGRSRQCGSHSSCPPCPLDQETRTAVVTSWGQWGEWSGHLRPCTEGVYRSRQRFCPNATNQDGHPIQSCCVGSSEEFSCYGDTCPDGSPVVSWSQWVCNETAQTSSRTGSCRDTTTAVVQNKTGPVVSWVEWSPWSPSCGGSETVQSRSRLCQVPPDNTPYCSTCGYQNTTQTQSRNSTIPPCCEDLEYGPWSPWSPGCGELPNGTTTTQSRSRMRDCTAHLSCPPCPPDQETRTAVVTSWGQWGEWSGHLRPCAEGVYRSRQRFCPSATNQDGHPIQSCCVGSSEEFSCCGGVLQLTRQSCSSTTSCLYECRNVASHIASDAPSPLVTKWVCLKDPPSCDTVGDVWNKTVSVPTATVPPLPVYVWPIIVLTSVFAVMLLIAVVITVLCYKYCKKKKTTIRYQLVSEHKDSERVYDLVALDNLRTPSDNSRPEDPPEDPEDEFMATPHRAAGVHSHTSYHSDTDKDLGGDKSSDSDEEFLFSNEKLALCRRYGTKSFQDVQF